MAKLQHAPPDLLKLRPEVPAGLAQVVMRTLSFEPGARFEDVSALRAALVGDASSPPAAPEREGSDEVTLPPPTTTSSSGTTSAPTLDAAAEGTDAPTLATKDLDSVPADVHPGTARPGRRRAGLLALTVCVVAAAIGGPLALTTEEGEHARASEPERQPHKAPEVTPLKAGPDAALTIPQAPILQPSPGASAPPPGAALRSRRLAARRALRRHPAPRPHRPAFATVAHRGALSVNGYDDWTAAVHLDAAREELDRCVSAAPVDVGQAVRARLRMDDDGGVLGCEATGAPAALASCFCSTLRAQHWSPPPGGSADLSVRYSLE